MSISARDLEYIETRLLAPCVPASDAHERLRKYTVTDDLAQLANRLMYAMQEFTNVCRDVRTQIIELERSDKMR